MHIYVYTCMYTLYTFMLGIAIFWTLPKSYTRFFLWLEGHWFATGAVKRWTVGLGTWRCLRSLAAALVVAATGGTPSHWARLPGAGEDWRLGWWGDSTVTIIKWVWSQGWALMYCKFFKLVDLWKAWTVCVAYQVEAQPLWEETSRKLAQRTLVTPNGSESLPIGQFKVEDVPTELLEIGDTLQIFPGETVHLGRKQKLFRPSFSGDAKVKNEVSKVNLSDSRFPNLL